MVNLNDEEEQDPLPLEFNFTTKKAELKGTTYTFSFPNMWRTSRNKNIIGIRKINYFKGPCNFRFYLCFVWKSSADRNACHIALIDTSFNSTASLEFIADALTQILNTVYNDIKKHYGIDLGNNYFFKYSEGHFKTLTKSLNPVYEHKIYITFFGLNETIKDFFNLHNKPLEKIAIYVDSELFYLELYNISELNEVMCDRDTKFQVCCSFVPQSDIQYVGLVNETFTPIKYYSLKNENRYFQMKLMTFDGNEKTIAPLENDSIIIEAQLL